jgi:hypothetical protein
MIRIVRFAADHYMVVPLGSILALAWANTRADSYFTFAHSWSLAVNDLGMTLFFALVTQEIVEATMPGGALGTWRRALVPIVAATGGPLGSVLLYLGYLRYVGESASESGTTMYPVTQLPTNNTVSGEVQRCDEADAAVEPILIALRRLRIACSRLNPRG